MSPSGRYALSAGWVWHPVDALWVFDLHKALEDPRYLDHDITISHNVGSAAFLDDDLIVYAIIPWPPSNAADLLGKTQIDVYSIEKAAVIHSVGVDREHISVLPTSNQRYVWDIFNYPKIIDLHTGAVTAECPELNTNGPTTSIDLNFDQKEHPPFARHPDRRRPAVWTKDGIVIVTFED